MHLNLTAKQRALVASVERFAAEWLPAAAGGEYFEALSDRGWSAPGWPKPWGGGLAPDEAFLVERTLGLAGAPMLDAHTLQLTGPLLLTLADEVLCHRYLPRMAAGGIRWALHGSLFGAAPLESRLRPGQARPKDLRILARHAGEATAIAMCLSDGMEQALAVAELRESAVLINQPLDPDTVLLNQLHLEVLASTRTHPHLAAALLDMAGMDGARLVGLSCWTGRLRRQYDRLLAVQGEGDETGESAESLAALGVTLTGLEVMEQRAALNADGVLRTAVAIRSAELGRAMAELAVARLGYYALPAIEPSRQHNELPASALAARDAMAELIRYLDGEFWMRRDNLAQGLGLAGH